MKRVCVWGCLVMAWASTATAQDAPAVFVTGGVFASIERAGHEDTSGLPGLSPLDPSGTAVGGSAAIGTFVSPHWSVRLEFAFPASIERSSSTTFTIGATGVTRAERQTLDVRTPSVDVLAGYHTAVRHHVSFAYLGGIGFVESREHYTGIQFIPADAPVPQPSGTTYVSYGVVPVVGVDATWQLTSHAALVPYIRAQTSPFGISIRPGVSVRWAL